MCTSFQLLQSSSERLKSRAADAADAVDAVDVANAADVTTIGGLS